MDLFVSLCHILDRRKTITIKFVCCSGTGSHPMTIGLFCTRFLFLPSTETYDVRGSRSTHNVTPFGRGRRRSEQLLLLLHLGSLWFIVRWCYHHYYLITFILCDQFGWFSIFLGIINVIIAQTTTSHLRFFQTGMISIPTATRCCLCCSIETE
jgi:hypothetical protein